MLYTKLVEYCRDALEHYGQGAQIGKAIEECGELKAALVDVWCDGHSENIIGEIADVLIMAEQMRLLFGADAVDAMITKKIERQRGRMGRGE